MRLHILSDLHIEFEPFVWPEADADLVILAGDIHIGEKGLHWINANASGKQIIYVLGNHEYYGKAIPQHAEKLKRLSAGSNVSVLENEKIIKDGIVFLGCTLWTDYQLYGNQAMARLEAESRMSDYKKIRCGPKYRKLRSTDTLALFSKSLAWLSGELAKHRNEKIIVVTHHAPSARSIPEAHAEDILNAAYVSRLDQMIQNHSIALWIHGHLHVNKDYGIGKTRVICNPKGYPEEHNTHFIPGLVVEV